MLIAVLVPPSGAPVAAPVSDHDAVGLYAECLASDVFLRLHGPYGLPRGIQLSFPFMITEMLLDTPRH